MTTVEQLLSTPPGLFPRRVASYCFRQKNFVIASLLLLDQRLNYFQSASAAVSQTGTLEAFDFIALS